ncbi:MAG: DUF5668 domain-containing protein [Patescibacteria group bacterium]
METPEQNLHPDYSTESHRVSETPVAPAPEKKIEVIAPKKRHVNLGGIFLGIIILFIGFGLLGKNLGIIPDFSVNIFELWPILIIVAGLSLLSGKGRLWILFGTLVMIVCLCIVAVFGFFASNENDVVLTSPFSIERGTSVQNGQLTVHHGMGNLNLIGDPFAFIDGELRSSMSRITSDSRIGANGTQYVEVGMDGENGFVWGNMQNDMDLRVSDTLPMDLVIESGASNMNLDFRTMLIRSLDLKTGASGVNLQFGNFVDGAQLGVEAGASSVEIYFPTDVGVEMRLDAGLTSKNLHNFHEVSDGVYQSDNYDRVNTHVTLDLTLGAADLTIDWLE